jgi:hypothetical protein
MRGCAASVGRSEMNAAFLEDNQAGAIKIQNGMPFDSTTPLLGISLEK